jgi:hypothetical protein
MAPERKVVFGILADWDVDIDAAFSPEVEAEVQAMFDESTEADL